MLHVNNFHDGPITPAAAYLISCVGIFIGLRCATRAHAYQGADRTRWLSLAALSIGITGIWAAHYFGVLGFTIQGAAVRFNVLVTVLSMIATVAIVGIGLMMVGFGRGAQRNGLLAGLITGIGVAAMYYTGVAAMRIPGRMTYSPALFAISVIIIIAAMSITLWAAVRLHGASSALVTAMIVGLMITITHYIGMAAIHVYRPPPHAIISAAGSTAGSFLLPVTVGITSITFAMIALLAMSPTAEEIHDEAALLELSRDRGLEV